jgi:glycosyltransferase involved in cell wall biosynthesis
MFANPEMPLVSICIPCFNQERYLHSLFSSLLAQTYSNLEILFADDCSTDNSWGICQKFADQLKSTFPRVHFHRNEKTLGALRNMSAIFKRATGDFISYLESDDYYRSSKVQQNLEFLLENPSFGAVHSDYVRLKEDYSAKERCWRYLKEKDGWTTASGWIFEELLIRNFVCAPSLMVRREYFKRAFDFDTFAERDYKMGDYPALLLLSQMTKIGYIDEPLVFYRELEISMSHSPDPGEKQSLNRSMHRVRQDARFGLLKPSATFLESNRL